MLEGRLVDRDARFALVLLALGTASAAGCRGDASPASTSSSLSALATLGEKIFHDPSLSASGQMSCATCHDEGHAFSSPNDRSVQLGGPLLDRSGTRSTPAIRYLTFAPAFHFDDEGTPTGGLFWDGRAGSLALQAGEPLLNPAEMANADQAEVVSRLMVASYADDFRSVFGARVFEDVAGAYLRMTLAIQQYEREDPEFQPFSSKYDAFLRGEVRLDEAELRGLALFNRAPGDAPALDGPEIADVIAFLKTLDDGYAP